MNNIGEQYMTGRGRVWLDTILYADCYECEFKRKDEYQEIDDPNGDGKVQVWVGLSYEGSVKIRKNGAMAILAKLEQSRGYVFDVTVKEFNLNTGYFETKKYIDCTVEEFPTSQFASKKITEVELSIKARKMQLIA